MAAELERQFGVKPRLIRGGGGIFDVRVGSDLVFSKFRVGRFPDPDEVEAIIRRKINR